MHMRPMLSVQDLDESLGFYRSRLGFEVVEVLGEPEGLYWAYLKKGTAELMLTQGPSPSFPADPPNAIDQGPPNGGVWLYVYPESVDELERLHADLAVLGQAVGPLETTDYGHRLFTLRDPDGYVLTFGVLISADLWPS